MTASLIFYKCCLLQHFCSGMRRNQNFEVTCILKLFIFFLPFFFLLFLSFCCSDWPTGLASHSKSSEKALETDNFCHGVVTCIGRKFCSGFFTQIMSIFLHISGSPGPINLIWVSLESSFPPTEVEHRWCQFWSKVITWETLGMRLQRPRLVVGQGGGGGYRWHRSQWLRAEHQANWPAVGTL